jgi:polysaccharide biosynthesis protein PslH
VLLVIGSGSDSQATIMKVLIITAAIPFPPISGGQLRTFHIARAMAREHKATLVGFTYGEPHEQAPYPVNVVPIAWEPPDLYARMKSAEVEEAERAYKLLDQDMQEPWLASCYNVPSMEGAIREQMAAGVDVVLFEGTPLARFLPLIPSRTPKILDLMDVCTLMAKRAADSSTSPDRERAEREARRVRVFESWAAKQCHQLLLCSEQELQAATELLGANRGRVVPNGVDANYFRAKRGRPDAGSLLFTANFGYGPNAEAAQYFVREVLPLVLARVPIAHLQLVGAQPPPAVRELAGDSVHVHGRVEDMRIYQDRAAVVVVPLLRGGGTKLKLLEAAASANAIVTTTVGVEGLAFTDGEHLLVRDHPHEFADAVVLLLQNPDLAERLGAKARAASEQYDWTHIEDDVCDIVNRTLV